MLFYKDKSQMVPHIFLPPFNRKELISIRKQAKKLKEWTSGLDEEEKSIALDIMSNGFKLSKKQYLYLHYLYLKAWSYNYKKPIPYKKILKYLKELNYA